MGIVCHAYPEPTDDFGVLWALTGIRNAAVLEHGPSGSMYFNGVMNLGAMNRTYPKGSVFTTGIEEEDLVLGGEDRLIKAIKEIDREHRPEVLSVVATAVSSLIGVDLQAVALELQPHVRARLLVFDGGGFRGSHARGIQEVFRIMAGELVGDPVKKWPDRVNILGPTMACFNYPSDLAEIKRLLNRLGLGIHTVFTRDTAVDEIRHASSSALNIVTRDLALETAESLQQRYGIPYCYGLPFGIKGTVEWMQSIAGALDRTVDPKIFSDEIDRYGLTLAELTSTIWRQDFRKLKVAIAGPYDYAMGLARFVDEELGLQVGLVCLTSGAAAPSVEDAVAGMWGARLLVRPEAETLKAALEEIAPQILFGGADVSQLAGNVPIHIRSAMPAHDCLQIYDGTPFVGFRGALYLTQTVINAVYRHREVLA